MDKYIIIKHDFSALLEQHDFCLNSLSKPGAELRRRNLSKPIRKAGPLEPCNKVHLGVVGSVRVWIRCVAQFYNSPSVIFTINFVRFILFFCLGNCLGINLTDLKEELLNRIGTSVFNIIFVL